MIKTNIDKVVCQSQLGAIHHPLCSNPYRINYEGTAETLPATGGITYNVSIGDCVYGLAGDHVEPGVSMRNENKNENKALCLFSCIGNTAKIVSGEVKGRTGYITGVHGGIDHVLVHFDKDILEELVIGDKIQVKGYGQGLKFTDYPEIHVMSIDPSLLLNIVSESNGKIKVPIAGVVPAHLMGSGIGSPSAYTGDYDIMTNDWDEIVSRGLDKLRFGDIVVLEDCDNRYGRGFLKGAKSIGVIVHSDCIKLGHGPGVTTIMTCTSDKIETFISEKSNILDFMK